MTTVPMHAGWYSDPSGGNGVRYFDGDDWAQYVPRLSKAERAALLDNVVIEAVRRGARVESRTSTQAVLVFGSNTSGGVHVIHFLLTLMTCGLWVVVWILVMMTQHEKRKTVTVDQYGYVS